MHFNAIVSVVFVMLFDSRQSYLLCDRYVVVKSRENVTCVTVVL